MGYQLSFTIPRSDAVVKSIFLINQTGFSKF
uniref:Uncharacterized protein n=1 Tax=Arundo donax TaxID=35708 RepID=A0A0A8ZWY4_ARUDO